MIIAVHDHQHAEVTKAFAEQGYHILCEKPMATSVQDCVEMENVIEKSGRIFGMGHGARSCLKYNHLGNVISFSSHAILTI